MNNHKNSFLENGNKVTLAMIVTMFIIFGALLGYKKLTKNEVLETYENPKVSVATSVIGSVVKYINAIGTLRPFDSVIIKSEVNAKIEKIHFSEGHVVKEGTLLLELDNQLAIASLMEAEAQYQKAKSEFIPIDKLANKGVMAKIQRDTKKAEMDMAAARVNSYKTNLEKHKISAPFGGMVGLKEISKGQFVSQGNDLLKIVDCHPLKIDFKVPEIDIGNIYIGQKVIFYVGANNEQKYTATINAIDPESDKISHTFDVRGVVDVTESDVFASQVLKPGRFVSVKIAIDAEQKGILVPETAIEKMGDDDILFRIVEGEAIRTLVTTGMRRNGNIEIINGLNDGELVVITGHGGVMDGQPVDIQGAQTTAEMLQNLSKIKQLNQYK